MPSRRETLAVIGSTALLGLSGCTWLTWTTTDLSGVEVVNPYYGIQDVDVRVEQAGEMVFDETLSVDQEEGAEIIPCVWDREGEDPIIEARLADEEFDWERLDFADNDQETAHVTIIVRPEVGVTSFDVIGSDHDYFFDLCADES